ncbi:MAG: aminodeoxychorismate lyase [Methylotenera sp.]
MARTHSYLINGSFDYAISPFDRGFAYGDGVFRTLVMRAGVPESWPLHYQKLVADCAAINIVCPSAELLMSDMQQLFTPDEVAVAKIIVTRGEGNRGYTPPPITAPMRVVTKSAMPEYPEDRFIDGVNLIVCETRLALQPKLAGIKHLNRLENVLARMEWNDQNIVDGILLDTNENVIECTAANILARFGDTLITPSLAKCGVAGVTRQRILELAHTLSLKPSVETFNLEKLFAADEVIICNSIYDAWQVKSIQDKTSIQEKIFKKDALAANIRAACRAA